MGAQRVVTCAVSTPVMAAVSATGSTLTTLFCHARTQEDPCLLPHSALLASAAWQQCSSSRWWTSGVTPCWGLACVMCCTWMPATVQSLHSSAVCLAGCAHAHGGLRCGQLTVLAGVQGQPTMALMSSWGQGGALGRRGRMFDDQVLSWQHAAAAAAAALVFAKHRHLRCGGRLHQGSSSAARCGATCEQVVFQHTVLERCGRSPVTGGLPQSQRSPSCAGLLPCLCAGVFFPGPPCNLHVAPGYSLSQCSCRAT